MVKHNNIPIFIPELSCPHQCIYCDQKKISGTYNIPSPEDVEKIVEKYLSTIPFGRQVNIAFFGGTFTGLASEEQEKYLKAAYQFVERGEVKAIRLSTRPDYINHKVLNLLKYYGVETIELGAQSSDNDVLSQSYRGHTREDIIEASKLIKLYGFKLGLQMMIGLPGDNEKKAIQSAKDFVSFGADNARIYPTLVIKGTALEKLYNKGKYNALNLFEAVKIAKEVYSVFVENNVDVIRVGLHPSEELTDEKSLVAGPYHPSFKELIMSETWKEILEDTFLKEAKGKYIINVNHKQLNYVTGYKSSNKNYFLKKGYMFEVKPTLRHKQYEHDIRRV